MPRDKTRAKKPKGENIGAYASRRQHQVRKDKARQKETRVRRDLGKHLSKTKDRL